MITRRTSCLSLGLRAFRRRDPLESGRARARFLNFLRVMVGELLFELLHLPIKLIDERVDRSVHVFFYRVGVDRAAADVHGGFGFVSELLDREDAMNVGHVIEVPFEPR